ncbi:hypothetical protein D3C84_1009430 [compost metagenome]
MVVAATEVDGHLPGHGPQLAGQVLALPGQLPGRGEGANSGRRAALGVVVETGVGQFQGQGQARAWRGAGPQQLQRFVDVEAVFLEQRQLLPEGQGTGGQANRYGV